MSEPLTYNSAGVNYDSLDAFKRACQRAASGTRDVLGLHGFSEPADVRGESAYLIESADRYLAHVEEGLGTKNLVADAMLELTGKSYYRNIGIDTVATIVNDLITCGALPVSVAMHAAVGDGAWFDHPHRATDLADGFAEGCRAAQAVWGGGETPALRGIVDPSTIVLAGSAVGQINPKSLRIAGDVQAGDAIVMLASSGVQTNGLTLCRKLAERLPQGYLTPLSDGRTYGEALLDPSVIYVRFVRAAQQANLTLRYAIHLTGHGWRKMMRLSRPFVYEITRVPTPQPVFSFIAEHAGLPPVESYGTFNMGVGFAAIVRAADADRCVELARSAGYDAWIGGTVRSENDRKAVEIAPLGLVYDEASLQLR